MFPHDFITDVSPNSGWIRTAAKFPMVFMLICSGVIGGWSTTTGKMVGELAVDGELGDHIGLLVLLVVPAFSGNLISLYFLNVAMKYYDQIENIPIYMASALTFTILSGLIVLNE